MNIREYDAVVIDNKDPEGRNRVKIRVQGHHPTDMPEKELPWCLVQPKIGANSGKGQKETLTIGQMCKVQPLDRAETEFKVIGGSNAFRDPKNKKGTPYSVIENSELFDVPIPDLASLDPEKLARTIFVPLMDKLTKRISKPVIPFVGACGTINPSADKATGGCGGGKPGCGGKNVPLCDGTNPLPLPKFQSEIRCRKGKVDCKKFSCICGTKPINYNMKFDWEKSVQTLSGKKIWVPCLESDISISPACNNQCPNNACNPSIEANLGSGCYEAGGNSCDGTDIGCNKRPLVCNGLGLCIPENTKCNLTEQDPNGPPGSTITGLQTNTIKLIATSKIPGDLVNGKPRQVVANCEYYCGNNACDAAANCPGGPNNKFVSDDPFALDITDLHEHIGPNSEYTVTIESGLIETVTIDLKKHNIHDQADFIPTAIMSKVNSIRNLHQQTLAAFETVKKLPATIFGSITAKIGEKFAAQADRYIQQMFGNMVNQANKILGEVQAAATRSINTAIDGAMKIVDNSLGALGDLDIDLGGIEKIPVKIMDQAVGGFGLGGVPGAFFHEVIRTDFLGQIENKFVTQYENGIAQVVDTSRGNKTWSIGTNDGARIEIANNGTTLVKGANDVQIATESGTVSVTGANQITIVDGKATVHCDSFTVSAKTVDIAAPAIALNGDVEIKGNLGVGGTIEAKKTIFSKIDVVVQKTISKFTSLSGHRHLAGTPPGSTGAADGTP